MAGATALFDAEISLAKDGREKATLTLSKAYALLDGGKEKEALAAFVEAVELDPSWLTGVDALGLQAVIHKDHAQLAEMLGKEAAVLTEDQHHRAAVLTHRARLLHRRLAKPEAAVEALQAALQLDARTPVALAALKRLLFAQSRWRELVAAHEMAASLTTDPALQDLVLVDHRQAPRPSSWAQGRRGQGFRARGPHYPQFSSHPRRPRPALRRAGGP